MISGIPVLAVPELHLISGNSSRGLDATNYIAVGIYIQADPACVPSMMAD